jgi:S-layer protein
MSAPAVNAKTGAAQTSLNSGDVIDGSGGVDTLTITSTAANNTSLSGVTIKNVENIIYKGSDNLATTTAGTAGATAAGEAEVQDYVVTAAGTTASTTATAKVSVNGVVYTTAAYTVVNVGGTQTATEAATSLANKAAAITTVLTAVVGGGVTLANTAGEITLTSQVVGKALPTIAVFEADGTTAAWALDDGTGTGNTNNANVAKTGPVAVSEITTITTTEGSTAGYAGGETLTVTIDGVNYGSPAITSSSTTATVLAGVAGIINGVLGDDVAVASGTSIIVTAPTAGTPLPVITVTGAGSDAPVVTVAETRANTSVGATSDTVAQAKIAIPATAENITIDGAKTTVTGLTSAQTLTLSGTLTAGNIGTSAASASANIVLKGASGALTINDPAATAVSDGLGLTELNISGAMGVTAASKFGAGNAAAANKTLTIVDGGGLANADVITDLNLAITSQGTINTASMDKLEIVNASKSTGKLTISANEASLTQVWGGSGNDTITVDFDTDDLGLNDNPTTATVNAGAGDDTITLSGAAGDGDTTLNGQDGDDTFVIASAVASSKVKVVGGAGSDTVLFDSAGAALTASEIAQIKLMDVENIALKTATTFDGEVLSGYGVIAMVTPVSDVLNVNSANIISVVNDDTSNDDATVVHEDYIPKGYEDALTTTRAGNLTIAIAGATPNNDAVIDAKAESVTLSISPSNLKSDSIRAANVVDLKGDVETATVVLNSALNYRTNGTDTILSTIKVSPTSTANSIASAGTTDVIDENTGFADLGALTSLIVTGVGVATIDNSGTGSKLVDINLSGLGGARGAEAVLGTGDVGDVLGSSGVTLGATLAETLTLGSATDVVTVNGGSTYAKFDTIVGFDAVKESGTSNSTVDSIVWNSGLTLDGSAEDEITEVTLTSGAVNLDLAIIEAIAASGSATANTAGAVKFFNFEGDTYIVQDLASGTSGSTAGQKTLEATDLVLKVTGVVDFAADWAVFG